MAPESLERILSSVSQQSSFDGDLLVGLNSRDDAAVIRLNEKQGLVVCGFRRC